MAAQPIPYLTVDEYLRIERQADLKSEYVDGRMVAMGGASLAHNRITFSVGGALYGQLRGGPCAGQTSDQRVLAGDLVTYPDVVVICGKPEFYGDPRDTVTNPTLIVEVLSESTERCDRGLKFANYRQAESLREYVLVAQDQPHVEVFSRLGDRGEWVLSEAQGLERRVELRSIGCTLSLADVYDRAEFPAAP